MDKHHHRVSNTERRMTLMRIAYTAVALKAAADYLGALGITDYTLMYVHLRRTNKGVTYREASFTDKHRAAECDILLRMEDYYTARETLLPYVGMFPTNRKLRMVVSKSSHATGWYE